MTLEVLRSGQWTSEQFFNMNIVTRKNSAKTWRNTGYGADITGVSHKTNNRDIAEWKGGGEGRGGRGLVVGGRGVRRGGPEYANTP